MIQSRPRETTAPALERIIADARSDTPGPTLVTVGGVHGNEPAGIEAAERVHERIDTGELGLRRGRLVSLRGNLAALRAEAEAPWLRDRYIDEDLNRAFRGNVLIDSGSSEDRTHETRERDELAAELARIVAQADGMVYLMDLHTVSSESPAFLALEDSLPARRFAKHFPLPKLLGMEEELEGLLIDYSTNALGCVSCIVESGRHDDPRSTDVHEAVILLAASVLGLHGSDPETQTGESAFAVIKRAAGGRAREYHDIRERVPVRALPYETKPEAEAFSRVRALHTIIATEDGRPVTAESSGLLFLPNRQRKVNIGDDAFFVIARVGPAWLSISAWIRRRPGVHRWLPRLLPGVRQRPGDPDALLVAPEYAAILRRELLHLLGYRLIRWGHTPYLPRSRRVVAALIGLAKSILGVLRFAGRGGERAALPGERDEDWVVRRRRLDQESIQP